MGYERRPNGRAATLSALYHVVFNALTPSSNLQGPQLQGAVSRSTGLCKCVKRDGIRYQ